MVSWCTQTSYFLKSGENYSRTAGSESAHSSLLSLLIDLLHILIENDHRTLGKPTYSDWILARLSGNTAEGISCCYERACSGA